MKRLIAVAVAVLGGMALAAQAPENKAVDGKYKFAVVVAHDHPYFAPMKQAVKDAAKDFGIPEPAFLAPKNWDQKEQDALLDAQVVDEVKGIALCTCDPVAGNDEIAKLVGDKVPVVAVAMSPAVPSQATLCLATDVADSAYQGTKRLIAAMGGKGGIVHLSGNMTDGNTKKRMDGVAKAVSESAGVRILQTLTDIDFAGMPQTAISTLLAEKESEIDGIICTAYIPSTTVATEMRKLGKKRIKVVAVDTDKAVLDAIRDGTFVGTMAQNPYGQAYVAVYTLKLIADGYTLKKDVPFMVDSGTLFVDNTNLVRYQKTQVRPFPLLSLSETVTADTYPQSLETLSKDFIKSWAAKYFEKPARK